MHQVQAGQKRILIAEKDEEVRHMIAEALRLGGYDVYEVDRPAAIDLASPPCSPDLFLIGHGETENEGFDLLGRLRSTMEWDATPAVLLAVEPDEELLVRAVAGGADGLLPFPSPMEAVQTKIHDLLAGGRTSLTP